MENKIVICIIDETKEEMVRIRRTFKMSNYAELHKIQFDFVSINPTEDEYSNICKIIDFVMQKIKEKTIDFLIIDYQLITNEGLTKGTDILKKINAFVPLFPAVILTENVNDSFNEHNTDCDKIYNKKDFYDYKSLYHQEKIKNIVENSNNYKTQLAYLINKRNGLLQEYESLKSEEDRECVITKLLDTETNLQLLYPIDDTLVDKTINAKTFKNILDELKSLKEELGYEIR